VFVYHLFTCDIVPFLLYLYLEIFYCFVDIAENDASGTRIPYFRIPYSVHPGDAMLGLGLHLPPDVSSRDDEESEVSSRSVSVDDGRSLTDVSSRSGGDDESNVQDVDRDSVGSESVRRPNVVRVSQRDRRSRELGRLSDVEEDESSSMSSEAVRVQEPSNRDQFGNVLRPNAAASLRLNLEGVEVC